MSNRAIICIATTQSPSELDKTLIGVYVEDVKGILHPKVLILNYYRIYVRIKTWLWALLAC